MEPKNVILKHDTDGTKGTLDKGEFGYDDYDAGGDAGRVYIGDGADNLPLALVSDIDGLQQLAEKGVADGYASLNSDGQVPSAQLPGYVDDVVMAADLAAIEAIDPLEESKIYVAEDTNITYRWSGTDTTMVEISSSLALGETESTAHRGDRGKIAYDHSLEEHAPTTPATPGTDGTDGEDGLLEDSDKYKLDFIEVTQAVDLDQVETDVNDIKQKHVDTNEPTGFIREQPLTMGIIELSPDGTLVHRVDHNGVYSEHTDGLFYDGSDASAREFAIHPVSSSDGGDDTYSIYIEGTKHIIGVTQKVELNQETGLKFVYHDEAATLALGTTFSFDYFEDKPITAVAYGNQPNGEVVLFGDERHGIQMDGFTHRYLHFTQGTQYVDGMEIQGLTEGGTSYTQITSGHAYDEDISLDPIQQSDAPHWYLEWDEANEENGWRIVLDSTDIAKLEGGVAQYNENVGGEFQLTDVTGNDTMIMFFALSNNAIYPYTKILGQTIYADANGARADISNALNNLVLSGLPSPEFLPIGALIVNASGELQDLTDGSLYFDLREAKISGSGTISSTATYHPDLLDRDTADSHPASAISTAANGNVSESTVQLLLEQIMNGSNPEEA